MFKNYIYKDNLHHAYFIEDNKEIIPHLLSYFKEELGFNIIGNKDFYFFIYDNFKIDDAKKIIPIKSEKPMSGYKKFVLIYTNFFTNDAQNALLKMFEETIKDTHFFIICPNKQVFIPTLLSRFYSIKIKNKDKKENKKEKDFLKMNYKDRIFFIKEFIKENEEESLKVNILNFINNIESILYFNYINSKNKNDINIFEKIIEIRKALFLQGSSHKMLFEALALNIKEKIV